MAGGARSIGRAPPPATRPIARLAVLLAPALLAACSDQEHYTFVSSEGDGAAIIIEKATGDYGPTTNHWARVRHRELIYKLVTVKAESYHYETKFGLVIPLDAARTSWGDERVACGYDGEDPKLIRCRFANGRKSAFRWNKAQGVTAFSYPCVAREGQCEFTLPGGNGPFSKDAPSLYLQ